MLIDKFFPITIEFGKGPKFLRTYRGALELKISRRWNSFLILIIDTIGKKLNGSG